MVLLENLSTAQKKQLGFKIFDARSKYVCSGLRTLSNVDNKKTKEALRDQYFKFSDYCNVKSPSEESKSYIRKSFFGRNKIAEFFFQDLEKLISNEEAISPIND